MAATSVAFFSGDQSALELANYIGTAKGQDPETGAFYLSAKKLLAEEKYTEVLTQFADESVSLLAADEKDFEPIYNLLIALIKDAQPEIIPKLAKSITLPIVKSSSEKAHLKLKVMSNLYNNVESNSSVRYDIFTAIINVAAQSDELEIITPHLLSVDSWLAEWGVGIAEKRALYLLLSQKLEASCDFKREAYEFLLKYLATYDSDAKSAAEAQEHALRSVKAAISIPTVLDFDDLHKLSTVQNLKSTKHFELLAIFLEGSLKQYQAFVKANPTFVPEQGLSEEDNLTKMRLLSMASLAANNVQGEVAYNTIAEALDVPIDEVEIWVINVIRAGLIDAKMNQLKQTVVISRSVHRVFTDNEWKSLQERLGAWRTNLKDVLQVIANAKLMAGNNGATVEAVIQ
ncbi:hypothetical protein DFJ77DRAFT_457631 [Powellomyces hirtus]|nr:hypothetical protein DFJ77DRAFT_457631 [Powellomyces hirtus]